MKMVSLMSWRLCDHNEAMRERGGGDGYGLRVVALKGKTTTTKAGGKCKQRLCLRKAESLIGWLGLAPLSSGLWLRPSFFAFSGAVL